MMNYKLITHFYNKHKMAIVFKVIESSSHIVISL